MLFLRTVFVRYLDYCLLMGYDFSRYNPIFPIAEFNSPLFSHKGQVSFLRFLNLEYASNLWVRKGALLKTYCRFIYKSFEMTTRITFLDFCQCS